MSTIDAQFIRQLAVEQCRNPDTVRAVIEQLIGLERPDQRRAALAALVDQLLAADEPDAAVRAARLAPGLTPPHIVNNVDLWLPSALLLKIADYLLERHDQVQAATLLDEAAQGLDALPRYEPVDLPNDRPWQQLTRRYRRIGALDRIARIWAITITWAQSLETSLAVPDSAWFQPEDGSHLLVGIVAEMLELGAHERAQATASAIHHEPHRTRALALLSAAGIGATAPDHGSTTEIVATLADLQARLTQLPDAVVDRADALAEAAERLATISQNRLPPPGILAADLWERVRSELVAFLNRLDAPDGTGATPQARVRLGRVLGRLGDPRMPLHDQAWQASLAALSTQCTTQGAHYWRYLPAGRHWIGGWAAYDPYASPLQRDQWVELLEVEAFWLARLPVTVAQFRRFVAEGYDDDSHWTPHGLQWRRAQPASQQWDVPHYNGDNQPVVSVNWYEALAFCNWLNARLHSVLPEGYTVRLPSEAEWEVAAAFDGTPQRRTHPWGHTPLTADRAATAHWGLSFPAPVGLCPAGMAACGALDLAGGAREWSGSAEESYPKRANTLINDHSAPQAIGPLSAVLRGVSWREAQTTASSAARSATRPDTQLSDVGFRLALAPRRG